MSILTEIWERQPDTRFNQLKHNLQKDYEKYSFGKKAEENKCPDLFNVEDEDFIGFLQKNFVSKHLRLSVLKQNIESRRSKMKIDKMFLKQINKNRYLPDEIFNIAQISDAEVHEKDNLIIVKKCDLKINEFYYTPLTEIRNLYLFITKEESEPVSVSINKYKINRFDGTVYLELLVKAKPKPRVVRRIK